jgi:hypothetical protein
MRNNDHGIMIVTRGSEGIAAGCVTLFLESVETA